MIAYKCGGFLSEIGQILDNLLRILGTAEIPAILDLRTKLSF